MYYKTNWNERLQMEKERWKRKHPDLKILVSSADRWKNYTDEEIQLIKKMKKDGATVQEIANTLQRSYWSVAYKWREINKRP